MPATSASCAATSATTSRTPATSLIFIETFRSDHYEEVSLANWLSHLPPALVSAHLNIPEEVLATFPRGAQGIVPLP